MSERVDFSGNASVYDRRHGDVISDEIARALGRVLLAAPDSRVLDLAAGTGRVAIPLATLGHRVIAFDAARPMLDELARKSPGVSIPRVLGDGMQLPFRDGAFDEVVIARLLYLVPDWMELLREVRRVLATGGRLLHEWSNGGADEAWVQIREKLRSMFEADGVTAPFHPGVRTEDDVEALLAELGMRRVATKQFGGGHLMTIGDFLARLAGGECSYTWAVPKDILARRLPELQDWAASRFDLTREVPMPREIIWRIYA